MIYIKCGVEKEKIQSLKKMKGIEKQNIDGIMGLYSDAASHGNSEHHLRISYLF